MWHQLIEVRDGHVRFETHYRLSESGEQLVSTGELQFRTQPELTRSLTGAGFEVEHVFGDWDRQPVSVERPEFIFVAVRG